MEIPQYLLPFGRPFVKRFALCYRTVVLSVCLSVCDVGALWPNGWMDQDETWQAGRYRPWPHSVRWGPSLLPQKGRSPTQFSVHVYCGQTAASFCMDQDATWYGGRPRPTQRCVRCGPSYPQKKGTPNPPNFGPCLLWPYGWMDENAAWYGSRPRPRPHCTTRSPSSRERGTAAPLFSAHVYCGYGRPSQLLLSSCLTYSQDTQTMTVLRLIVH